jgi:hypothetical protein
MISPSDPIGIDVMRSLSTSYTLIPRRSASARVSSRQKWSLNHFSTEPVET